MGSLPLSFLGALRQWNRPGIARLPAEGSPGPGLRELRQRVAFLGRWLCKIVGTAVSAGPPPSLAPSCQAVVFKTEAVTVIQAVSVLTVCREKRGSLALRRPRTGGWLRRGEIRLPGTRPGFPASCFGGRVSVLALPNRALQRTPGRGLKRPP